MKKYLLPKENEGFTIIKYETYFENENSQQNIVLAVSKNNTYVTWEHMIHYNSNRGDNFFWGHYFPNDQLKALQDYHARLLHNYINQGE